MAAASPTASNTSTTRNRFFNSVDFKENLTGYLFILPAVALIAIFGLFPIGYAFYMSLRRWRVRDRGFIGIGNYEKALGDWMGVAIFIVGIIVLLGAYLLWDRFFSQRGRRSFYSGLLCVGLGVAGLFTIGQGWTRMIAAGDDRFLGSLPVTFYYALGTVPIQIGISLVLAYLLFQKIRGQEFFRMIYFLPYVTPVIATAFVFRVIFSPRETSMANSVLDRLGIEPQRWLFEAAPMTQVLFGWEIDGFWAGPSMALVSIIFFGVWTYVGFNTVIFLAGLGNIPPSLYEAAKIDGASAGELFRHITVPLLSPITYYLSLVGFIGTFKAFNHIFVMQQPAAQGTVATMSVSIFNTFYKANQFGYATAQAIILLVIILFLTFVQTRLFGDKVFYG